MRVLAPSLWKLLLLALREGARTPLTHAQLRQAGTSDRELLASGLIRRLSGDAWSPPGCEQACSPNLDFETRQEEGLVGVACPYEEACWPGWQWVPADSLDTFQWVPERIAETLRATNGLEALATKLPPSILPVGLLRRRGLSVPVVFSLTRTPSFEQVCIGVRTQLDAERLVVVLGSHEGTPEVRDGVALLDAPVDAQGDLRLWRALDMFDPSYRARSRSDPSLLVEDVQLEFASRPGAHVLKVDGRELDAFAASDLKFLRLLLLAATRKAQPGDEDGWLAKHHLEGDEKDHDLQAVRDALGTYSFLVKRSRSRDGRVRLAVPAHAITLDDSLKSLALLNVPADEPKKRRLTPGAREHRSNAAAGHRVASRLLAKALKILANTQDSGTTGELKPLAPRD